MIKTLVSKQVCERTFYLTADALVVIQPDLTDTIPATVHCAAKVGTQNYSYAYNAMLFLRKRTDRTTENHRKHCQIA